MSKLVAFLPRLALFGVMVVVGFVISSAVVQALQDRSPQSAATEAPDYVLAGAPDTPGGSPEPVVFNVEPSGSPETLESLAPADLTAAADSLLGAEPAPTRTRRASRASRRSPSSTAARSRARTAR